ncbi:MAG: electron transfer flavoprotein subunit alpha [Candidatus Thermoplasmatota archaeon]|nr:electron transfer flavoprotein subunit alpha [Candidatus Thermoplasmatota archaeon]
MIEIDVDICTGCEKCVEVCPVDALYMEDGIAVLKEEECISCGACVSACPVDAIEPVIEAQEASELSKYEGVWVFAEQHDGTLKETGPQLLGKGRELADELDEELCAVVIGNDIEDTAEELFAYGAEKVYMVEGPVFEEYSTEAYTAALARLISKYEPNVFLYGATHLGRDLAPSVAGRLGLGLTADCTGLSIEEVEGRKVLQQTRPAFGGNVMADIVCPNSRPQMATVRPHVMSPIEPDFERDGEIIEEGVEVHEDMISKEVLEILEPERAGEIPVEEADIVVTGGRGVGDCREDFGLLEELADLLDGTVGCSRPIVEEDIMPKAKQVGQSGKTISPNLYIVCGVSGAIQHKVGIRDSDHIVAINNDPDAPIFEMADFGIVGDVEEVVPALIKKLKNSEE